jgi:hypothetical protein
MGFCVLLFGKSYFSLLFYQSLIALDVVNVAPIGADVNRENEKK